jgi:hypothetical protein
MGVAPGIQLGIGLNQRRHFEPPWSVLRLRVGCPRDQLNLVLSSTAVPARTPQALQVSMSPQPACPSHWLATAQVMLSGAAIRRTGCAEVGALHISDVQRDLYSWMPSANSASICSHLKVAPPPSVTEVQSTLDPAPGGVSADIVMPANFRLSIDSHYSPVSPYSASHEQSMGAVPRWRARPS